MEYLSNSIVVGAGATALLDAWTLVRARLFGARLPDYGLVGRWFAYLARGRFRHDPIAASPRVPGERLVGWAAHYATGVAFAAVLLALSGPGWARAPTLWPALLVGIGSVAAPFLLMQPGMGAGIAARRTPRPNAARAQSLLTHTVFGVGLFASAWLASLVRS